MNQKRETFRSVTLWTWILVQGIVTPIFCFYPSAPTEARVRWVAVVAVLLTLIYGLTVGRLDIAGRIGGLLSVQSWLDKERKKRTSREPQLSDEKRLRQGLDQLRVSITTAIGAALGAQMVSLHRDPANLPDPSEETLLVTLATFFIVACLSSVFQINLFALLGQVIWNQNQKDQFRLFVRYLATLSSQCLIVGVILLLALLPYPWTYACLAVNFLYGIAYHKLHFLIAPPVGFPNSVSTTES